MTIWRYLSTGFRLLFRRPMLATSVIAVLPDGRILLVQRRDTGQWSLPGGIVDWGETVERCARRELREETGCCVTHIERLVGVYSSPDRDPRFHAVSVAIAVGISPETKPIEDTREILTVKAFAVQEIPFDDLSHDHAQQLKDYFAGLTVVA